MKTVSTFDYRPLLAETLEERIRTNPSYSLRAFARQMKISPSHLSRVLKGEKAISVNLALKISSLLNFSKAKEAFFLDMVRLEGEKDQETTEKLQDSIGNYLSVQKSRTLEIDSFKTIADWYHFAIISLLKTKCSSTSSKYIAKRLGLSELEAQLAVDRLLRLELVERRQERLIPTNGGNCATEDELLSMAIKKNHKQNILRSIEALDGQPLDEREFGNISLSVRRKDLPKIKKKLKEVLRQLNTELDTNNGDEVYQLNLQFYRVTK